MKYLLAIIVSIFSLTYIQAQSLDMMSKTNIILKDGTNVVLYGSSAGKKGKWPFKPKKASCAGSTPPKKLDLDKGWEKDIKTLRKKGEVPKYRDYYYLPPNETVRMPVKNGKPVFSFIVFQQDEGKVKGKDAYGILTFDLIFGLSKAQEKELIAEVKKMDPAARVKGQANLRPSDLGGGIRFISSTVDTLIKCSILPPRHPGEPFSASVQLSGEQAAMLRAYMEDPRVNDVDLKIEFAYNVAMTVPGVKAGLYINKCKLEEHRETITHNRKGFNSLFVKGNVESSGYELYEKLIEDEVVNFNIELGEYLPEELRTIIIQSFFDMFVEQLTEPMSEAEMDEFEKTDPEAKKRRKWSWSYSKYSHTKMKSKAEEQSKTVEINLAMNILEPVIIRCSFGDQLRNACQNLGQSCPLAVNLSEWKVSDKKELVFTLSNRLRDYLSEGLIDAVRVTVNKKRKKKDYEKVLQISSDLVDRNGDPTSTMNFTYINNTDDITDVIRVKKEYSINEKYYTLEEKKYSDGGMPEIIGLPASLLSARVIVDTEAREFLDSADIKGIEVELRYKTVDGEKSAELNLYDLSVDRFASQSRSMIIPSKMKNLTYRYKVIGKNHKGELVTPWYTRTISDGEVEGAITKDIHVGVDLPQCDGCFDKGSENFLAAIKRAGLNVSNILDEYGDVRASVAEAFGQIKEFVK